MNKIEIINYLVTAIFGALILVLPHIFGFPNFLKTWKESSNMLRVHRRAEHDFALALNKDITMPNPHIARYAEELGYAALVGDRHLLHAQRKVLLAMPNSQLRISQYLKVRTLLTVCTSAQGLVWTALSHRCSNYRKRVRIACGWSYLFSMLVALLPWVYWMIFNRDKAMPNELAAGLVLLTIYGIPTAIFCLVYGSRISQAERLMKAVADESINQEV
jgi:hypothetical protein